MSKDRQNIPCANLLMGSMRSMGYTFEAAIADIIDNSISAHSENVQLLFPTNPLDYKLPRKYTLMSIENNSGNFGTFSWRGGSFNSFFSRSSNMSSHNPARWT